MPRHLAAALLALALAGPAHAAPGLSLGGNHSCAVDALGAAWCWGDNSSGQVGDGTIGARIKVEPRGLSAGVAAVGVGEQHACALLVTGAVKCWGRNDFGQLGNGSTVMSTVPGDVAGLAGGSSALAVGHQFACALTNLGAVRCWGNNDGNLGRGDFANGTVAVDVVGLDGAVEAIAAGGRHACALTRTHEVRCWGKNDHGQVGDGTTATRTVPVVVPGLVNVVRIFAGGDHTCAITAAGDARCWGSNAHGELGDGTFSERHAPVDVVGLAARPTTLALADAATCALSAAGAVSCWGRNEYGELGLGYGPDRGTPAIVTGFESGQRAIAAGGLRFCAVTPLEGLACWGANYAGELGNGSIRTYAQPVAVAGLAEAVKGVASGGPTCARLASGALRCWGDNQFGQLGEDTKRYSIATSVRGLSSGVAQVEAGENHTCALMGSGDVVCWGSNEYGQLGDGTNDDRGAPGAVSPLGGRVKAISSGGFPCAMLENGAVWCWGVYAGSNRPRELLPGGARAIASGRGHACAIVEGGGVRCWGSNDAGQLGRGTAGDVVAGAVDVVGLAQPATALALGTNHSCALLASGGVKCWGGNSNGELGNASSVRSATPVDVAGFQTGVRAIAAIYEGTCALTVAGSVWCWGGYFGDIGAGNSKGVPYPMPQLSIDAVAVGLGFEHACALLSSGAINCVGTNGAGQLGDGTRVSARGTAQTVVAADGRTFLDLTPVDGLDFTHLSPFVAVTSGAGAGAAVDVRPTPRGAGAGANLYVFALVPAGGLASSAPARKDGAAGCVLSQVDPATGALHAVSVAELRPAAGGVLDAQGRTVDLLAGITAGGVSGARFFAGVGATGASMIASGTNRGVLTIPGAATCDPQPPRTGWWWNPAEPGRGYSIEVRGGRYFFAAFLYDVSGRSTWLVSSGTGVSLDGALVAGDLLQASGGQTLGGTYPGAPRLEAAGSVAMAFVDARHGVLSWPGGITPIERFDIVPGGQDLPPQAGQPEAGWWWNPDESGRGFFLEWQGGTLDMAGYLYDEQGRSIWLLAWDAMPAGGAPFSASWWSYANGQAITGTWKPNERVNANVAPVTVRFTSPTTAIMALPNGRTTNLQRHRF